MARYYGSDKHGQVKGPYKLKDKQAVIGKCVYLRIVFAIINKQNLVNPIIRYIGDKTENPDLNTTITVQLKHLVKLNILIEDKFNEVARGRKKIQYKINYIGLSEFILQDVLFRELEELKIKLSIKDVSSTEIITAMSYLLELYLKNINNYLENEQPNKSLIEPKRYLDYAENRTIELKYLDKKTYKDVIKKYKIIDLRFADFTLLDVVEGFFKYLISNPKILINTLANQYKKQNEAVSRHQLGKADILMTLMNLYFSKNRSDMLSQINKYYEFDTLRD